MNNRSAKNGFTLIEILVASAIIVTIVSMVYGSYFATSKSAQACKSSIELSGQGRTVLEQMARQIRCSYIGSDTNSKYPAGSFFLQREKMPENTFSYYDGGSNGPGGQILHFVTTNGNLEELPSVDGLFEVTYKFDESSGTLFVSRERFIDAHESVVENRNWRRFATNIKSIELAFSDGWQWLRTWDFTKKKSLPNAVKISITCDGEDYRQYHYSTVAHVCCSKNQAKNSMSETLVSINK